MGREGTWTISFSKDAIEMLNDSDEMSKLSPDVAK